jgi:hypothetical protein
MQKLWDLASKYVGNSGKSPFMFAFMTNFRQFADEAPSHYIESLPQLPQIAAANFEMDHIAGISD